MSDLEILFVVFLALYAWECAWWLDRSSVAFRTWLGGGWRPVFPGALLGNPRGGFAFTHPLPPLGQMVAARQFPFSLSPDAVLLWVASSVNPAGRPIQSGQCLRFDELKKVGTKGRWLRVDGVRIFKACSILTALRLAETLRQLRDTPPKDRAAAITALFRQSLDVKSAQERWKDFNEQVRQVRYGANSLFLYVFVGAPLVVWQRGIVSTWPYLLGGTYVLTLCLAVLFRRIHKKFYLKADDDRFSQFLMILLWPVVAMRAHDILARPLFEEFHPLAIANLHCSEARFREFARTIWREILYPASPLVPAANPLVAETEHFSRETWKSEVERFLKKQGVPPDSLLTPPEPADESSHAYCPRCLAQFTSAESACTDCGGLALKPFVAAPAKKKTEAAGKKS